MRYQTLFDEYLHGTLDYSEWSRIYDLLVQIDSYNECIKELEFRERLSRETDTSNPVMNPRWMQYTQLGWYEFLVRLFNSELEREYGIRMDECYEEPEEIIDGQISIEDYIFSLNPVFRISRPDLIEVHP